MVEVEENEMYCFQTKHYLEEAQVRYKELFDKMQSYYQPEKGFRGEDRWLHLLPSGETYTRLWSCRADPMCVCIRVCVW